MSSSESSENRRAYSVGACKCHFINRLPKIKHKQRLKDPERGKKLQKFPRNTFAKSTRRTSRIDKTPRILWKRKIIL